ncbi:MAG: ABC transporter ATP-binding protein [Lachnospiraceae bacterium]|nr:ABC transporter ATP-binding protein [Lachnospiraceae bacterium]
MRSQNTHTLRKFIRYYRPYRWELVLDLFCALFISVVDLLYPQLLRSSINGLFRGERQAILASLPWIAVALVTAYVLQTLAKYYVTNHGHVMGAKMERDMRRELFDQYERLSFSYYDKGNTGQLMARLVSDLFDISEMAHHGPENLFIASIKVIGAFIFLFIIQPKLALILCVVVAMMVAFSVSQRKAMRETFADNRRKIGDINATLQDSLSGIRVVQAFANEPVEEEKFRRGNEAFLQSKRNNYRAMGRFASGNSFFTGMLYTVTLVFGGLFIANGDMEPSDLAMYALYIGVFVSPIQILVELMEMLQKGLSGFRRFLEVVETEPEIVDAPDAEDILHPDGEICYDDVSFRYEEEEAVLDHVSFTIRPGQSIALVGPSGSGKTTICSLLPRFYDVTGGRITIGGQDIAKIRLESLRRTIGIVQQDVYLFGGTVRENIAYGKPDASEEEIIEAAKRANIHEFVMSLPDGYDTYVGERGTRLSGGQKQRISIARVFLKNPPILILDEATSALDNESERYIQASLDELAKNRTTITIAHRLSTIQGADEILVVEEHGITERGTHAELLAHGGTYAMYQSLSEAR